MYYRLKPDYVLRGWQKMTWAVVKRPENGVLLLTQEQFQVLILCDGETELPGDLLNEKLEKTLRECMAMGLVEADEKSCPLNPEQYYVYYDNRCMKSVFWSITGRCNFRCRHCYMDAPDAALGELSTEQMFNIIDQMAECGILRIELTGGEPFVRKDFWQLVDRILERHMTIGVVFTNGWLLNGHILDEFEKRGIKPKFSISFDGVGWHDWMRGIPGAEEAALRALKLCHDRGFSTEVETCIHRGNLKTIPQTLEVLRSVGVKSIKMSGISNTMLWRHNSQGNALTDREYVEAVLPYITWYYKEGMPFEFLAFSNVIAMYKNKPYGLIMTHYKKDENYLEKYVCPSARMSAYITPEGRLLPCIPMTASPDQNKFPLIQDIGLKKGLSDSYYMQFIDRKVKDFLEINAECGACVYRYQCGGGCRASALLDGDHDLMGCDRIKCMLWKEGYVSRIRKIADAAITEYGGPDMDQEDLDSILLANGEPALK